MSSTNPNSSQRSQMILGIALFVVLLVLLGGLLWAFVRVLASLSPEVAAAIIAAAATILVSVASLIYTKRWERRSVIEQEHRKQKAQAYAKFMTFFFKVLRSGQSIPMPQEQVSKGFDAFTREFIVWGSSDVLRKFVTFRNETMRHAQLNERDNTDPARAAEVTAQAVKTMLAVEDVLYAIRVDLGHEKSDMKSGELLATFINDLNTNTFTPPTPPGD